jgi:site-specific DNA-methyltransferase (adenine-specific)
MAQYNDIINKIIYMDCIKGMKENITNESVDHFYADPPFGIDFTEMESMYNREKKFVIEGYNEPVNHRDFTLQWITEIHRVLKKDGTGFICSGWSNLEDILYAIRQTGFKLVNHIIWKYNFGVYTKNKFVTSHYHILFVSKGKGWTFNKDCRFKDTRKKDGNENYRDREDVWMINRPYRKGEEKNANTQPIELVKKALAYSTNKNDLILDPFMGGGTTAVVAKSIGRNYVGFEINPNMKELHKKRLKDVTTE